MSKSTSLHVLLALTASLTNQANAVRTDLATTFEKKPVLFTGSKTVFESNREGIEPITEEDKKQQTSVRAELAFIAPHLAKQLDAQLQIAEANTRARADIELENGTVLARQVPATALLELEKRVNEILALAKTIPTLDPAKGFTKAEDLGPDTYRATPTQAVRTKKEKKVLTVSPATDKFPAQCQVYDEDVPVGVLRKSEWSGMITPAEKTEILSRIEVILRAVKAARKVANDTAVDTTQKIGDNLLAYAFSGK